MNANDADISEESQHELALGDLKQSDQHQLAAGVLKQAVRDLRRFRGATNSAGQKLYLDAYRWLTADEFFWPFSFHNVCHALRLAPEIVRGELLSDLSLGTFGYWRRRCTRAVFAKAASIARI